MMWCGVCGCDVVWCGVVFDFFSREINYVLLPSRRHTVAFAPHLGRVYTFGLGAYGQLGSGDTKSCSSPVVAVGPWMASSSTLRSNEAPVTKIIAGGDHCFVLTAKAGVSSVVGFYYYYYYHTCPTLSNLLYSYEWSGFVT